MLVRIYGVPIVVERLEAGKFTYPDKAVCRLKR